MTLVTAKEAAAAALKYGLDLPAAAALGRLAETPAEAEELASMFASPKPQQLSRDDIRGWAPEKIEAARVAGQLSDVMGYTP